ncbi:MAG TPA: TolC family protein [bacterium]|nr:TolC family protein [bacterium]
MKSYPCLAALFLLAVGQLPALAAQDVAAGASLTLEAAQKEALVNSPVYRRSQDAEQEAGWGQLEAISDGFLPHLRVKGQYFLPDPEYSNLHVAFPGSSQPITFPGIYPEKTLSLDADLDLFDGFKNVHKLDAANNSHQAAKILSDWAWLQLQEEIRLKFNQVLAAKLLSDMADQNVKTLEDHLRIVQDQLDNGQATKYDVLRVDVQLSEAKSDQISAHDSEALARSALTQAMGLKSDDRSLSGELPVLDADALLKNVSSIQLKESPQLRAKELLARAAEDQSAAAHAFWFPRLSVIGEYQWYNSPDYIGGLVDNDNFRNAYFLGASASWDLLDGGLSVAKANEAGERAQQAGDDYQSAQLQIPYEFDLWKRRLVSSVSLYKAKLTDVDKAKESARLATVGFKAGTRTTTDVLDAELEEYRASAGVVQAQINALEALVNLELTIGKKLSANP